MRVSIVGAGYVGLVTAACLAEKGHELVCVDLDPERVAQINRAQSPIFERGLAELRRVKGLVSGPVWTLSFTLWRIFPRLASPMLAWRRRAHSRGAGSADMSLIASLSALWA